MLISRDEGGEVSSLDPFVAADSVFVGGGCGILSPPPGALFFTCPWVFVHGVFSFCWSPLIGTGVVS